MSKQKKDSKRRVQPARDTNQTACGPLTKPIVRAFNRWMRAPLGSEEARSALSKYREFVCKSDMGVKD